MDTRHEFTLQPIPDCEPEPKPDEGVSSAPEDHPWLRLRFDGPSLVR